jgi:hypothetical protein
MLGRDDDATSTGSESRVLELRDADAESDEGRPRRSWGGPESSGEGGIGVSSSREEAREEEGRVETLVLGSEESPRVI